MVILLVMFVIQVIARL